MYIVPGKGQTAPRGRCFDVNRNVLSLGSFVASFKISLKSDLIQSFSWFNTRAKILMSTERLNTLPICCKFKKISFEVWFYINTCIYPCGRGQTAPRDKVLMSTETSCQFGHLLLDSNHRQQLFLKNPLFYLFPIQMQKGPNSTMP